MIYVMSDIFGRIDKFHDILRQIKFNHSDTLYVLGNVIDGNKNGIKLIQEIMSSNNIKMTIGNHEFMMMKVINRLYGSWPPLSFDGYDATLWANNGGNDTIHELMLLKKDQRDGIFSYLRSLPYEYEILVGNKKYILTHSSPKSFYERWIKSLPGSMMIKAYESDKEFCVWHRLKEHEIKRGIIVVHGHTYTPDYEEAYYEEMKKGVLNRNNPMNENDIEEFLSLSAGPPETIRIRAHDIAINCSLYNAENNIATGRLACLCLDTGKEFYAD